MQGFVCGLADQKLGVELQCSECSAGTERVQIDFDEVCFYFGVGPRSKATITG